MRPCSKLTSQWLLGLVIMSAPLGAAFWTQQGRVHPACAVATACYASTCACLLLLRVVSRRMQTAINSVGAASCAMCMCMYWACVQRPNMQYQPRFGHEVGHVLMMAISLVQLSMGHEPRQHTDKEACRVLLLPAAAPDKSTAAATHSTIAGLLLKSRQHFISQTGPSGLSHTRNHVHSPASTSPPTPTPSPSTSPKVKMFHNMAESQDAGLLPAQCQHYRQLTAQQDEVVSPWQFAKVVTTPYRSKLGAQNKVCVKLDTQLSCSDLPPDLAYQMQQALARIGVPTLHISDLAVREGCIMITLDMRDTEAADVQQQQEPLVATLPADVLAKQLLQELQLLCGGEEQHLAPHGGNAESQGFDCQQAQVQVGEQLMCVARQDGSWQVQPAKIDCTKPVGIISPRPSLGVAHATMLAPTDPAFIASSMPGDAVVQAGVEVQVWGLCKLDEVDGWTPPAPGQHHNSMWQTTSAAAKLGSKEACGSRQVRLLAQLGGMYVDTNVQRIVRAPGTSRATVQAIIMLPSHQLVRHHPGGIASSMPLMSLELWHGEVFLNSTPIISLALPRTTDARMGMHAWWWGVSEATAAGAASELHMLTSVMITYAIGPLPSFVMFLEDWRQWLLGVQSTACSSQYCLSTSQLGTKARPAASHLSPAALQALGEGLIEHAAVLALGSVQRMLIEQMHVVVQPTCQTASDPQDAHGCLGTRSNSSSNSSSRTQRCARVRRNSVCTKDLFEGYPCSMCEARYRQQLGEHMVRVQPLSSLLLAVYGITAGVRVMYKADPIACMTFLLPWVLLHMAGAIHSFFSKPGMDPIKQRHASLYWTLAAYCVRLSLHWSYALHLVPTPEISKRLLQTPFAWAVTHLMFVLVEQVQSSVILSPRAISFVAVFLDLPCVLLRALRGGWWVECVVLAPLAIITARPCFDMRMRRLLQRQQHASGQCQRGAVSMAGTSHPKKGS